MVNKPYLLWGIPSVRFNSIKTLFSGVQQVTTARAQDKNVTRVTVASSKLKSVFILYTLIKRKQLGKLLHLATLFVQNYVSKTIPRQLKNLAS